MATEYKISGMTCHSCVEKVQKTLNDMEGIQFAKIQLEDPQARLLTDREPDLHAINHKLQELGDYTILQTAPSTNATDTPTSGILSAALTTYKPLVLVVAFIAGISLLVQLPADGFSGTLWMRHFMAGFFLVFGFFKILDLKSFAQAYSHYDMVSEVWYPWGYIYPFLELALGVSYLLNLAPLATNLATIVLLGVSSVGVIKSNVQGRKIQCACLGAVFDLPMSRITIVEDVGMVIMAAVMMFYL